VPNKWGRAGTFFANLVDVACFFTSETQNRKSIFVDEKNESFEFLLKREKKHQKKKRTQHFHCNQCQKRG